MAQIKEQAVNWVVGTDATNSAAFRLYRGDKTWRVGGILLPAAFTGIGVTFQGALKSAPTTFYDIYGDDGVKLCVKIAQGLMAGLSNDMQERLKPFYNMKLRSVSSVSTFAAATEGANRTAVLLGYTN